MYDDFKESNINRDPDEIKYQELPSAFELFMPSFEALKVNFFTYVSLVLIILAGIFIIIIVALSSNLLSSSIQLNYSFLNIPLILATTLVILIFTVIFGPAITYIQICSAKGKKILPSDAIINGLKYALRYILLGLIVSFLMLVGFILFIIPGLIVLRKYYLSMYYLIDKDLGVFTAMKKSSESSKPYSWRIYDVLGVSAMLSLAGLVPLLGFIAGPILQFLYSFAPAIRYLQIKQAFYNRNISYQNTTDISSSAPVAPKT